MQVAILVLNYNGRSLLAECLPSVLAAARASRHDCRTYVVDNSSTDDSCRWLAEHFPEATVLIQPNRGLCSFNEVLRELPVDAALLLNNDIKLDVDCVDRLVEPLRQASQPGEGRCFLTAARCWLFDGRTYEGQKTAVAWRWGLVQATSFFPGHEAGVDRPGDTASAGAAVAVDRRLFLQLGGFDPLYLPGRLEDLDLCYRADQAGLHCRYVPEAVAFHRGMGSFGPAFTSSGCDLLALRNTLLFQWKNLRLWRHAARQATGLPLRLLRDVLQAPWLPAERRWIFVRALIGAVGRWTQLRATTPSKLDRQRERSFFRRFHPQQMCAAARCELYASSNSTQSNGGGRSSPGFTEGERQRDRRHPISRWYLLPGLNALTAALDGWRRLRPWHATALGAVLGIVAAVAMALSAPGWLCGSLILGAWVGDRLDGKLARRRNAASSWGAWLDANLDETLDVAWQAALAIRIACSSTSPWNGFAPWLLAAFLGGKFLFFHSRLSDAASEASAQPAAPGANPSRSWRKRTSELVNLPGNADVRLHLLLFALCLGAEPWQLAFAAGYYPLRAAGRWLQVARRAWRGDSETTAEGLAADVALARAHVPVGPAASAQPVVVASTRGVRSRSRKLATAALTEGTA